jgi:RNA polymerase sigma-54 factor
MTLLGLSSQELHQKIESELAKNPALELSVDSYCPTCHKRLTMPGPCPVCSRPRSEAEAEPIIFVSSREDITMPRRSRNGEDMPDEEWTPATEELPTFVLRQIAPELDPQDRPIAAHILTSLDEDGLLAVPLIEIARYHHVPPSRVESVLQLIQRAEPVGVGSPNPQQALLVQLNVLSETQPVPELAHVAIEKGWEMLSHHAYSDLARLLSISTKDAQKLAHYISENLNPFPGRTHWGGVRHTEAPPQVYRQPDVIITRLYETPNTPLVVEVVSPFSGQLRVNPLFREALSQAPENKVDQWQQDLEQATLLIKCLQQRNHTIVRLMERLVVLQRSFILHGDAYLSPVTRAKLAKELEVHESTISRAVSSKSVQLPNGRIVPLSKLFDRSLHVRTALREIIARETTPLSDTQIRDLLEKQGYDIARRTVAKYRAMEGILPARYRQSHISIGTR